MFTVGSDLPYVIVVTLLIVMTPVSAWMLAVLTRPAVVAEFAGNTPLEVPENARRNWGKWTLASVVLGALLVIAAILRGLFSLGL